MSDETLRAPLRSVALDVVYELRHRKPNVTDEDIAEVLARAALAATPPPPLDVERLAQAIANAGSRRGDWVDRIAAEYERLATGEPEPK